MSSEVVSDAIKGKVVVAKTMAGNFKLMLFRRCFLHLETRLVGKYYNNLIPSEI